MKLKLALLTGLLASSLACSEADVCRLASLDADNLSLSSPISLAVDSARDRAYVVNSNNLVISCDASLAVLDISDPANPSALELISIPNFSGQIRLETNFAYISNRLSSDAEDNNDQILKVSIDPDAVDYLETTQLDAPLNPFGLAFDEGLIADTLFSAGSGYVNRHDLTDNSRETIALSFTTTEGNGNNNAGVRELALSSDASLLYLSNRFDRMMLLNISEFAQGVEAVDYVLTDLRFTRGVFVDSTDNRIYIVQGIPSTLKIIDETALLNYYQAQGAISGAPEELEAAFAMIGNIPLGRDPNTIVVDNTNRRAYVANFASHDISVIDIDLLLEVDRIALDDDLPDGIDQARQPFGLALVNDGADVYLYVTSLLDHKLTILQVKDGADQSVSIVNQL